MIHYLNHKVPNILICNRTYKSIFFNTKFKRRVKKNHSFQYKKNEKKQQQRVVCFPDFPVSQTRKMQNSRFQYRLPKKGTKWESIGKKKKTINNF